MNKIIIVMAAVLLWGCASAKNSTNYNPGLVTSYTKPTFEPMMFDQYKNAHPELLGLDCGIDKFFDKYINVYGVTIAAMPKTPVPEIIHAAKIYAQLIDNDENFHPDDIKIYQYHQEDHKGRNSLIVLVDNKLMDNKWIGFKPGQKFWVPAQALRPGHSGVGHSRDGEMDIAVEELFHKYGKSLQSVYPQDFGLPDEEAGDTWASTLTDAMDTARGINRTVKPVNNRWIYPESAWYTYDDTSCGWGCQVDEYLWHVWATNIGYYEMLTRPPDVPKDDSKTKGWCENLRFEWKLCTRKDLKETDLSAFNLINSVRYQIPNRIPFGEYGGNQVEYHGYEINVINISGRERFTINRRLNPNLKLKRGNTYYFDQSLKKNSSLPLRFSSSEDGIHGGGVEYRNGVVSNGVPGVRGSYVRITVPKNAPSKIYLYSPSKRGLANGVVLAITN